MTKISKKLDNKQRMHNKIYDIFSVHSCNGVPLRKNKLSSYIYGIRKYPAYCAEQRSTYCYSDYVQETEINKEHIV